MKHPDVRTLRMTYKRRAIVSVEGEQQEHVTAMREGETQGAQWNATTSCGIQAQVELIAPLADLDQYDRLNVCGACLAKEYGKPLGTGAD